MINVLTSNERLLQDAFARLFERESSLNQVRAAAERGFDPALWTSLVKMGAPVARVPEALGGQGLSLLDAAIIAEEAGRSLASVPLIECMVAARLLGDLGDAATTWLERIAGGAIVVLALEPAVGTDADMVPGGSVAEAVVVLHEGELVLVSGPNRAQSQANFGQLPVARWELGEGPGGGRVVLASGGAAVAALERARAEWQLLSSMYLAALSRQALVSASAYANERTQFGRPIGSFQGLAHPLADAVTQVEGAQLFVRRTVADIAARRPDAAGMISLCWWHTTQASVKALRQAIRSLGGYGLCLEYDLHIYHRRGSALALLGGDPDRELAHAGNLLFNARQSSLPDVGDVPPHLDPSMRVLSHRERLSAFFAREWDDRMRAKAHHSTASHDPIFHRRLAEEGLIFGSWPTEYGGLGHGAAEEFETSLVFEEWNYTSHVLAVTNMVAQIVMLFGTEVAKTEVLPQIKSGNKVCGLGFSEPSSGSDVFSARMAAVRDGGDWVVNGQKMFTTGGHFADFVLLLTRTSSSGAKHEGLTLFLVPTSLPGYSVQPVQTYQDERTNISFYTNMRIPDRYRLGEVGQGVSVMGAALALEHGGGNYFSGQTRMLRNAMAWASTPGPGGIKPVDDARIRARLAAVRARVEIASCFVTRSIAGAQAGVNERYWGSMAKLFITETFLQNCWEVLEMGGPQSIATGEDNLAMVELDHRRAYGTTIYGGTSEIHRSLVGELALGLPKSRS